MKTLMRGFIVSFIVFSICGMFLHTFILETNVDMTESENLSELLHRDINSIVIQKNEERPSLLDFRIKIQNASDKHVSKTLNKKLILFFNIPAFFKFPVKCKYASCLFTRDKRELSKADAILFHVGKKHGERMGTIPPISKSLRNPNQVWIFQTNEAPEHFWQFDYQLPSWHDTMNWSIHYTLNSDIPYPYGTLLTKSQYQDKDYAAIYKMKTKNALWFVSHCDTFSLRRQYVDKMIQYGFDVDILGLCGSNDTKTTSKIREQMISSYKFYLGFENSLCTDYVTEKYFLNYNFDWIVVVRGGADYHRLLPAQTFISTSDFSNISAIVNYLTDLGNDEDRYIDFLRQKDRYTSQYRPVKSYCEVCRRLNNLSQYRNTYHSIADVLSKDQCVKPTDL